MKLFREGLSTGSCAAAAAKAATMMLVHGVVPDRVEIVLPDGSRERLTVVRATSSRDIGEAAVLKDGGDDPDVTHGAEVAATVAWSGDGDIHFRAGEGIGTVTRPGLSVPQGEPAINPVPRKMIRHAVREVTAKGIRVTISIPDGARLAEKTYNPRLGIVGGLSILGTSGRVRPFSTPAIQDALRCSFQVTKASEIDVPVLVPGRIGDRAARRHFRLEEFQVIEVGNQWGFALDRAVEFDFDRLLIVGHPGKLAKLGFGHFDTHSSASPSALPLLLKRAAVIAGETFDTPTVEGLFKALGEDDRLALAGEVAKKVAAMANRRSGLEVSVLLVDMEGSVLARTGELAPWL